MLRVPRKPNLHGRHPGRKRRKAREEGTPDQPRGRYKPDQRSDGTMNIQKRVRLNPVIEELETEPRHQLKRDQADRRPVNDDGDHVERDSVFRYPHTASPDRYAGVDPEKSELFPPSDTRSLKSLMWTLRK